MGYHNVLGSSGFDPGVLNEGFLIDTTSFSVQKNAEYKVVGRFVVSAAIYLRNKDGISKLDAESEDRFETSVEAGTFGGTYLI